MVWPSGTHADLHAGLGELPVEDLVVVHLADGVVDDGDEEVDEDEHGGHLVDEQEESGDVFPNVFSLAIGRDGKVERLCESDKLRDYLNVKLELDI